MFKKKAKKLEVKSETPNEAKVEIKINVRPLVKIERHQLNVNGRDQKPEFRIEIGGRDVITVSGRFALNTSRRLSLRQTNEKGN